MTDTNEPEVVAYPKKRKPALAFLKGLKLSFREGMVGLLMINLAVTGSLLYKVETNKQPVIATVGVTSLTRLYASKVANDPTASPEMIKAKTEIFQDVVRKKVQELATQKGVMILARECVLTGEAEDLTPDLETTVNTMLKSAPAGQAATGGLDSNLLTN